jgi:hypothetical protein
VEVTSGNLPKLPESCTLLKDVVTFEEQVCKVTHALLCMNLLKNQYKHVLSCFPKLYV